MFDDLFNDIDNAISSPPPAPKASQDKSNYVSSKGEVFGTSKSTSNVGRFESGPSRSSSSSSYYSNDRENFDGVVEMIVPPTKPKKNTAEKPMIVVIDDDFPTIDLMKIYLQREYEYVPFDNAREAIFYLNKCVPDLIFLDCYISIVKSKKVIEIIRSYPEFDNVPIYLLAEPDEIGAMNAKLEKEGNLGISGIITRPVARGALQEVLDKVFPKKNDSLFD